MLIDLHSHELRYSADSSQNLFEMTAQAARLGLDAICVTDHDELGLAAEIGWDYSENGVRVFIGSEVFTFEGDILVFGARTLPAHRVHLQDLYEIVRAQKGALIAAHPYRHNNRGLKDGIIRHAHLLTAVEAYNGSTYDTDNAHAHRVARSLGLPVTGAGDSHHPEAIGRFATRFSQPVSTHAELVRALQTGDYAPYRRNGRSYEKIFLPDAAQNAG